MRRLKLAALAALVGLAVPAAIWAKSPTKEVSYVVEAKIFTKFLFENNGLSPTEGFQGEVNGIATEFEMNIRGWVSDRVEALVRIKNRFGATWSDYFLFPGSGQEVGPLSDDADYMKLRGATVRIKDIPLPTNPTLWVGSSDLDKFSPFTIGRIRFTERDNAKGVFVTGKLGPGVYDFGRVSIPRLWAGPFFNTGDFPDRDFAYGFAYDVSPTDRLRVELFTTYTRDNEFLGLKIDGDDVLSGGLGGEGTAAYLGRYRNWVSSFEITADLTDTIYLNAFGGFSTIWNNTGPLSGKGCCSFSPVLHPVADDPATSQNEGESLSGGFGIVRLEAYEIAETPITLFAEGFVFSENFSSIMAARRESDVLLTRGFTHHIGNQNLGNNVGSDGVSVFADTHQVASLAADNGFIDWDESIAETVIGWQGFTLAPRYEADRLRVDAEFTYLTYGTNGQDRDLTVYPDFEFVGGGAPFGIVDSTGTSRDVRDIYNLNQERDSQILFLGGKYTVDLFETTDISADLKYVRDQDEVDLDNPADDYDGKLMEFGAQINSQISSELALTLGARFYRFEEENALRVERPFGDENTTLGSAIAEQYDTDRNTLYAQVRYLFGAAEIAYSFEYFDQTRDIVADGIASEQNLSGRMRSKATVTVGF